ncbi:MAG: CUB domain-containing protein [Candidatus Thiodiazotropha sp.]
MPRNSVVRLTDCPDMTLAVDWDVKQQNNQKSIFVADPTQECGGLLTETTGELHSMDLDGNGLYDTEAYCQWLIVGERDAVIELTFLTFELEADTKCNFDAVSVSSK